MAFRSTGKSFRLARSHASHARTHTRTRERSTRGSVYVRPLCGKMFASVRSICLLTFLHRCTHFGSNLCLVHPIVIVMFHAHLSDIFDFSTHFISYLFISLISPLFLLYFTFYFLDVVDNKPAQRDEERDRKLANTHRWVGDIKAFFESSFSFVWRFKFRPLSLLPPS